MFDYKLDTTMLPAVWVTWASTKGGKFNKRYWLNCKTGKKKETPEKWMYYPNEKEFEYRVWNQPGRIGISWNNRTDTKLWVKSGSAVRYAYVKYHKKDDVLEVAVVGIDTTRNEAPHEWKYLGERYFIRKDKTIFNKKGNVCSTFNLYEYHTAWNPNVMFSMLGRLNYNDHAINEFKKFVGSDSFTIGNGRCINIEYLWQLQEWYKYKQITPSVVKGKVQQMVDSLTSIELSNVEDKISAHFDSNNSYRYNQAVYFERIDDEWSVLRIFTSNNNETSRMYISDNGKERFASHTKDGWVACNAPRYKYNYFTFINKSEGIDGCKRIKYALDALNGIDDRYFVTCLFAVLKLPELEQLAKLGCDSTVKNIVMQTYPKAELKHWAGEYYNEKEKNILRKIGLSKGQLDYFAEKISDNRYYTSYYSEALKEMRLWFGNDLSHIDIASFKKYLEGFKNIKSNFWRDLRGSARALDVEYEKFVKNIIRLGEKNENAYRLINDTINSANRLNAGTRPEINWYFDDYSDIVRAHDALVALANAQDAERRAYWQLSELERNKRDEEKRKKVDDKRKEYEYEDDTYIIRLPKDLTEIINEGAKQSICIGGYTARHANGDTNLFFLRDKSEPDKPFYAIEMSNDKSIVQIHGHSNKWLGNNPEAIPTVIRWLRKNGIVCSNEILTCTAKGYGRTNSYVPMPVVD